MPPPLRDDAHSVVYSGEDSDRKPQSIIYRWPPQGGGVTAADDWTAGVGEWSRTGPRVRLTRSAKTGTQGRGGRRADPVLLAASTPVFLHSAFPRCVFPLHVFPPTYPSPLCLPQTTAATLASLLKRTDQPHGTRAELGGDQRRVCRADARVRARIPSTSLAWHGPGCALTPWPHCLLTARQP